MVKKLQITIFQPPQLIFLRGSELRGTLAFEICEPKRWHSITVTLIGKAHVSCGEEGTSERLYVNLQVVVWDKEHTVDGTLRSGRHSFPFQFTIPNEQLPHSFGGRNEIGSIRYYVEGRIGTGLFKVDHVVQAEFPFVELVDVNLPQLQQPVRSEVRKTVCCWFCSSGAIMLTAESPRRGYCIGEAIPLNVTVENGSSRQIQVSVMLRKITTFRVRRHVNSKFKSLISLTSGPIQARNTSVWCLANDLRAPNTEPTLTSCDILSVNYVLLVTAMVPLARDSSIIIPLTIGNISFRDPQQASGPPPPPVIPLSGLPQAPSHTLQQGPPSELTTDQPPSYELACQYY